MLIVDGLRHASADRLARTIARRFCRLAARSGMAENFDALSGRGLRDRAYTWTASVFLLLAGWKNGTQLAAKTRPQSRRRKPQ